MNDIAVTTVAGLRGYAVGEEDKRGWIDETAPGGPIVIRNPRIGTVIIGVTPMGYDQPLMRTIPGVPVLGYAFIDRELHFLALYARRYNIEEGKRLPEVSGGFLHVNTENGDKELPKSGALRELVEETGLDLDGVTFAGGNPFVSDRALFSKQDGDGNNVYIFEVGPDQLAHVALQDQLEMLPWWEFNEQTADGITLAAIARAMGALRKMGKLKVFQA